MERKVSRAEVVSERRRSVAAVAGACACVLLILLLGGALQLGAAFAALSALGAIAFVYLTAAAQADTADEAAAMERRSAGGKQKSAERTGRMSDALLDAVPSPILLIDADERILRANAAARDAFSLTEAGGLLTAVMRTPEVLEAVEEVRANGAERTVEYQATGLHERYYRARIMPISGARAAPGTVLITIEDETAVRRSEQMRVDFLANASHELRTPLASLSGFIETLRGHAKDDQAARDQFLAIMQVQAQRMRRLIDDLLSLSRIELNEHLQPTGVADLAAITGDVLDATTLLAVQSAVRLEVDHTVERAPVRGDRDQLVQVVQNLVDNAIKYTPAEGVVTVRAGVGATATQAARGAPAPWLSGHRVTLLDPTPDETTRYAWITVIDAGPGIAPDALPRLSERFFRVEGADTTERTGTGLGLAIVKHIMSRHRGGVSVQSAVGKGSAFTVFAPHTPEFMARLQEKASAPEPDATRGSPAGAPAAPMARTGADAGPGAGPDSSAPDAPRPGAAATRE